MFIWMQKSIEFHLPHYGRFWEILSQNWGMNFCSCGFIFFFILISFTQIIHVQSEELDVDQLLQKLDSIESRIKVLEKAYNLQPTHPLVLHLLIHIIEPLTDLTTITNVGENQGAMGLEDIIPQKTPALGHLIHMPSHIWFKLGSYYRAGQANLLAIENDVNVNKFNRLFT